MENVTNKIQHDPTLQEHYVLKVSSKERVWLYLAQQTFPSYPDICGGNMCCIGLC